MSQPPLHDDFPELLEALNKEYVQARRKRLYDEYERVTLPYRKAIDDAARSLTEQETCMFTALTDAFNPQMATRIWGLEIGSGMLPRGASVHDPVTLPVDGHLVDRPALQEDAITGHGSCDSSIVVASSTRQNSPVRHPTRPLLA